MTSTLHLMESRRRATHRVVAACVFIALVLSGCAADERGTLLSWVRDAGLPQVVQETSDAINTLATALDGLGAGPADVKRMISALQENGRALAVQADALAAEVASDNPQYERLRSRVVERLRSYAATAAGLDPTGDLPAVTRAIQELTAVSKELAALNTYIEDHGSDSTGAQAP